MKKLPKVLFAMACFAALALPACQEHSDMASPQMFTLKNTAAETPISSLLDLTGFTLLQKNADNTVRSTGNILFEQGKVVVLDNETDFQDIWVFDEATGNFLNKIGRQSETDPQGYEGLNDIVIDPNTGRTRCIAAAKKAFMDYDLAGNLVQSQKNGIFGEEIESLLGGEFVVYNEYNSTELSGYNHLVFYNKAGDIVKRVFPYDESLDDYGYDYTGFLSASDNRVWFNPPFCDTVFEVVRHAAIPRYIFDFGANRIPDGVRGKRIKGWDAHDYTYLSKGFVQIGNLLVFEYFADHKTGLGVIDSQTGKCFSLRDAQKDHLYPLLQVGKLYAKGNQIAFELSAERVRYLLNNNLLDIPTLEKTHPELLAALRGMGVDSNPILLYCSFKNFSFG